MRVRIAMFVSGAILLVSGVVQLSSAPAEAVTAQLPDLRMATLTTIRLDTTTLPGHRLLRYTAEIVNVGAGPFEARGKRPDTSTSDLSVTQRVYNDDGTFTRVPIPQTYMFWAGDGHNHFHLRDLEDGVLTRLDNGGAVGALAKHGFHFADNQAFDLALQNAPRSPVYASCGGFSCKMSALNVTMGLSVGWGDIYGASLAFQYIDITGLKSGQYMLTVTADASHWFEETDASDNSTWAKLRITNCCVSVLEYGPGA
jgi:Lysyl oxidase